jgi:hypothetical protein
MTTDHPEAPGPHCRPDELEPGTRIWYRTAFTDETGTVLKVNGVYRSVHRIELRSDVGGPEIDLMLRPDARVRIARPGDRGDNAGRKAIS